MSNKRIERFGKPSLFRNIEKVKGQKSFSTGSIKSIYNTNITSENSFKYDPYGSALKSSQQLSVDYDKFENHTFFNSAAAKTKIAFNKIINKYPFDGSLFEIEEFEDKLTGYERHILKQIPKYTGYLTMTGSSHIEVKNIAGSNFPKYSSKKSGDKVLNPKLGSISFEAYVAVPDNEDHNDMGIFYMSGSNIKIEAKISGSLASESHCTASFRLLSGSENNVLSTTSIRKGEFNHISFVLDRTKNIEKMNIFVNGRMQKDSLNVNVGNLSFGENLFICASGSFSDSSGGNQNYDNFSGSIKDFRIYHEARNENKIKEDYNETVYKSNQLVANFRFNEPTGSYGVKNYALDTSGNSLHSLIITEDNRNDFFDNIRNTERYSNPVKKENKTRSHVLFPDYDSLVGLNSRLVTSGSDYDNINPNIITNLIPPHYYDEIISETGESSPTSEFLKDITGNSIPGSADFIKTNILNVLLFSWANIFDEVKMFIDSFGNVIFSDYKDEDIVPDQMILFAAKHLGVELPPMFTSSTSEDFFDSKSVYDSNKFDNLPLKRIQSIIWKRILADASYFRKTKGTIESLKTVFKSAGIDPDKMFAFIEKGANTVYASDENFDQKNIDLPMINFSGSLADVSEGTINQYGFSPNKPHLAASEMHSDEDGFLTSGSWAVEGYYSFPKNITSGSRQSILRLQRNLYNTQDYTAGTLGGILNIVATKDTESSLTGSTDSVVAYFTDNKNETSSKFLSLDGVNIFDGDLWYVSFSKINEKNKNNISKESGDKYTFRCIKCHNEDYTFVTSSFYTPPAGNNIQTNDVLRSDLSGSQIIIGSQSLDFGTKRGLYTIPSSNKNYENINFTDFSGKVASVRFWSKPVTEKESKMHARDPRNYGTERPNDNSMFLTTSYERLRLHVDGNQPVTSSNLEKIILNDFSQNEKIIPFASRSFINGFEKNKTVNSYEKFSIKVAENKIDEINSQNKIRIRSFEKEVNNDLPYQSKAPVYNIYNLEEVNDDARFSIEMSVARIINEKINNEMAGIGFFEDILGKKNNEFSGKYHALDFFSINFFKSVEGEINIEKLLSVYTWLEASFEGIIRKALPKKTKFLGMNYVVEPHALERSKIRLYNEDSYMTNVENNETVEEKSRISIFTGNVKRF
jgi:hypothetical protein